MPVITAPSRHMGGKVVTELIDSVNTSEVTYTLASQQDTLTISNMSAVDLIVSVGNQFNIEVKGFKETTFTTEVFTEFRIKSKLNHCSFRAFASYKDVDENDEKDLSDKIESLFKFSAQADFVDIVENRVSYKNIKLKKVAVDSFDVYLDDEVSSVTYNFIKDLNDDFYKLNECYFGGLGYSLVYMSDAPVTTGTGWNKATNNWYTTTVGDTFSVNCPGGEQLDFVYPSDNRGGIIELVIDGDTANPITVSTFSSGAFTVSSSVFKVGLNPNVVHTVVGTFKGADPLNAPSGGTARGWVYGHPTDPVRRTVNGYLKSNNKTAQLLSHQSNKEFAIQVKVGSAATQVIPDHGTGTAFNAEPMRVVVDKVDVDLTTLIINKPVDVISSVDIYQHCYGVIPTITGNSAEFWTTHHFDRRGKVAYSCRFKALQSMTVFYAYPLMLPLSTTENTILTAIGNKRISAGDETDYFFEEEKDRVYSVALLSDVNKSYIAAGKLNFPLQSYRVGKPYQPQKNRKLYVWQRAAVPKLYFRSIKDLPMVPNDEFAWSGEIIVANVPNIYDYLMQ